MKPSFIVAAIAIVLTIAAGVIAYQQYAENITLKGQLATQSSPMGDRSATSTGPSESTVVEKKIHAGNQEIMMQYRCSGEIKKGVERIGDPAEIPSFCIGDYELVATLGDRSIVIASGHASNAQEAPVFLKAEPVASSTDALISFGPNCASTGDCGVGMPRNEVNFVLHTKDGSVQSISHFPPNGFAVWNETATKALFIPETCGGAGCDVAPLIGYDLSADRSKDITNERAVGLGEDGRASDATDPVGNRLPVWQSVQWNAGDTFTATVLNSDGSTRKINGTF
jgi:hypothetical protein